MAAEAGVGFARRLHRIYGLYTLGVLAFVAGLGALEHLGWRRNWMGATFLLATIGIYAVIGLLCRTTEETEYFVAGRRVPAMYNGMATAADWMSAASFIGTAGVLYLQGFGGLAYILGWTGGYCLVALLLAPYLRRFGQYTIPDFLGERYGGRLPRLLGAGSAVLVSFVYLVVQIYGVGLITSHLTGFTFEIGIFVGLGGVLMCSFLGGMRAVTWTQVAQYIVLILAYAVPAVWMSVEQTGNPVPMLAYGQQLQEVDARERELRADPAERAVQAAYARRAAEAEAKLADVPNSLRIDAQALATRIDQLQAEGAPLAQIQQLERRLAALPQSEAAGRAMYQREHDEALARARPLGGLPPHGEPFAGDGTGSARLNFLALVLCLMVGTAAMPHILMRSYTTPSVRETRRAVAWTLGCIVLLYLMAPALAVFVKHEVFSNVVGLPIDQLPGWLRRWGKLDGSLVAFEDMNGDGLLQFGELRLGGDMIVLAAPEIGGLPSVVTYLVAAGGLAAALSTADGLLLTISNALSHDVYYRVINPASGPIRRVMLAKMMVLMVALTAAVLASRQLADIVGFVTAAFSLAASAFFPALVLGMFWKRANGPGAVAGMLAGLALCLGYMAATAPAARRFLGVPGPAEAARWFDIAPTSAAVFAVPLGLAVIVGISLLTAPPAPQQRALLERLRVPGPSET
jgi:cation/acetate symporter